MGSTDDRVLSVRLSIDETGEPTISEALHLSTGEFLYVGATFSQAETRGF
jgi:hypothetical protein